MTNGAARALPALALALALAQPPTAAAAAAVPTAAVPTAAARPAPAPGRAASAERLRVMAPLDRAGGLTREAAMSIILYSALGVGIVIAIIAIKSDDELPASP